MTPLALNLFRQAISEGDTSVARTVASMTCFDVTAVYDGVVETAYSLMANSPPSDIAHGGLLFLPAESVWIEVRTPHLKMYSILYGEPGRIGYSTFHDTTQFGRGKVVGCLVVGEDTFAMGADGSDSPADRVVVIGLSVAASLLLINAPRGVIAHTRPPHKGVIREAKASGIYDLRPYHTIHLDKKSGPVGGAGGSAAKKAFHFCRSHVRHLPGGVTTRVRAHWRGDPALGVCRGDYVVG